MVYVAQRRANEGGPATCVYEGLVTVLHVCKKELGTESFKSGMARSFVSVGLSPATDGTFTQYNGTLSISQRVPAALAAADSPHADTFSIGQAAAQVQLESRDGRADSDSDSESCSDDDSAVDE